MCKDRIDHLFEIAEANSRDTESAMRMMLAASRRRQETLLALHAEGLSYRIIAKRLRCSAAVVQAGIEKARLRRPAKMHSSLRIGYEMHLAVGMKLAEESERIRAIGRRNLTAMRQEQRSDISARWLQRWEELLSRPDDELTEAMLANDEFTADLRQVTPFAGALDDAERRNAIRKARFLAAA